MSFVLHDDGAVCDLVSMADVSDFERDQVAPTQLAVDAQIEERKFDTDTYRQRAGHPQR